jgi:hypothetical protein
MTKPAKRPRDFSQAAKFVIEVARPASARIANLRPRSKTGTGRFPALVAGFEIHSGRF